MGQKLKVLFVDDDQDFADRLGKRLNDSLEVVHAYDFPKALQIVQNEDIDLVLLDKYLGAHHAPETVSQLIQIRPDIIIIVLTGDNDFSSFHDALQAGASDYVVKPLLLSQTTLQSFSDELKGRIQKALLDQRSKDQSILRNQEILESWIQEHQEAVLVGSSAHVREIKSKLKKYAKVGSPVLITGESGTGKDVIARLFHLQTNTNLNKFVAVNCAAFTESLIESELFGHVKGSFTGATHDKLGVVEKANGGTLFLDEVGDLPLSTQVKLLRVLESGEYSPVGSTEVKKTHFRLVSATNKNIPQAIIKEEFREDLYFRINSFPISTLPLRERPDDLGALANYFLIQKAGSRFQIPNQTLLHLKAYSWPGNIRELKYAIHLAYSNAHAENRSDLLPADFESLIHHKTLRRASDLKDHLALPHNAIELSPEHFREFIRECEKRYFEQAWRLCDGDALRFQHSLGISRTAFYEKIKTHRLESVVALRPYQWKRKAS